jgi:hypothetical protein
MPTIPTAKNTQTAKDALSAYHATHAALSEEQEKAPNHILPDFQKRHTKLIEDFRAVLTTNTFTSIDNFFQIVPAIDPGA